MFSPLIFLHIILCSTMSTSTLSAFHLYSSACLSVYFHVYLSVCLSVYLSVSSHLSPVFGRLCSTFCSAVSPLSAFHLYTFGCLRDFHSVCPLVHLSISMSVGLMICQYLQYILSPYLAFAVLSVPYQPSISLHSLGCLCIFLSIYLSSSMSVYQYHLT